MERESFENKEVAELLNKDFISIKVDREERPDIDHIYMTAIQALTGSGGWPLTVFLTPDAKPVTGGTYFPPEDRWGRPGMKTILPRLAQHWQSEPEQMKQAGHQMAEMLQPRADSGMSFSYHEISQKAYQQFLHSFDPLEGGFGGAPKFPRTHDLSFLLRWWKKTQDEKALSMVEKTLEKMARGGIYDHLGGGFHRYSTDAQWLVPHFEKMLYDQASLARTYLEAYQVTKKNFYADVARDIFRYLLRDMTSPEGGFYSAEDADSEGVEGKFYVWQPEEITQILGAQSAKIFMQHYDVTDQGNFSEGGHTASILHEAGEFNEKPARDDEGFLSPRTSPCGFNEKPARDDLKLMRQKLFEARKKRIHPYKDDKILTAWNAMMISSLAYGAQVLGEPSYADHAAKAAKFILSHLRKKGRLLRRFREKEAAFPGFQDDYAFFALSLLDLYEATFDIEWLEQSITLTEEMIRLFGDETGGFFFTGNDSETLIARTKEYYDGATPSGNSIAATLLLRLSRMTGQSQYEILAEKTINSNGASLQQYPVAYSQMLVAMDFAAGPTREIVLAGDLKESAAMLRVIRAGYDPNKVVLHYPEKEAAKIERFADFIKNQKPLQGKPTVYVCKNRVCDLPVTDENSLLRLLERT